MRYLSKTNLIDKVLAIFVFFFTFIFFNINDVSPKDTVFYIKLPILTLFIIIMSLFIYNRCSKDINIIKFIQNNKKLPSIFGILLTLYFISISLSSILSPYPGFAWLGNQDMPFGSLMMMACWLIMIVYQQSHNTTTILKSFAVTTICMTSFAIVESLGYRPFKTWIDWSSISYPAVTMGFRQVLGGWYTVTALLPLYFYRNRLYDWRFWVWLSAGLIGLGLCTGSAATLSVCIGLLIWILLNFKYKKLVSLFVVIVFSYSIFLVPSLSDRLSQEINHEMTNYKDYTSTISMKSRFYLWKGAYKAALSRPIFGWGDEALIFNLFPYLSSQDGAKLVRSELGFSNDYKINMYGPTYLAIDEKNKKSATGTLYYLRAHQMLIDEFFSHGLIGFSLLILLFFSYKNYIRQIAGKEFIYVIIILLPHLIFLQAWYYMPNVLPVYFMLVGTIIAQYRQKLTLVES